MKASKLIDQLQQMIEDHGDANIIYENSGNDYDVEYIEFQENVENAIQDYGPVFKLS